MPVYLTETKGPTRAHEGVCCHEVMSYFVNFFLGNAGDIKQSYF